MKRHIEHRDKSFVRPDGEEGFSIIEVLIAIAIFSIGVLGVASMQSNALVGSRDAGKLSDVTEKAVAVMEELTALPYNHGFLNTGTTTPSMDADSIDNNNNGVIDEAGEAGDFSVQWTVSEDDLIDDTKTITVTVSSAAANKQVTITSLVASI